MPDENNPWRRLREKEDAHEAELEAERKRRSESGKRFESIQVDDAEAMAALLTQAETMVDAVNASYQQYLTGVTQRPPAERRMQLDLLMKAIRQSKIPNSSIRFRMGSIIARYLTFTERWDRLSKKMGK